ncbi:MAG: hypothetical protein GY822_29555 [Deltaproteobacteria bacterium]|nr:hypothetical protein [Deltaproteobacteria bacterium]
MMHPKNLAAFMGLCFLVAPNFAQARSAFIGDVPNGSAASCGTCHVASNSGGPRNAFGQDVEDNLNNDAPDWAAIYDLDSDGDGQTNGAELGDPCGTWTGGTAPRTSDISKPGDQSDQSADPNTPNCAGDVVDAGAAVEDAGAAAEDAGAAVEDAGAAVEDAGTIDAGEEPAEDAGTGGDESGICACAKSSSSKAPWMGLMALAGVFFFRRKRS